MVKEDIQLYIVTIEEKLNATRLYQRKKDKQKKNTVVAV